jgi:hypothetical protein
MFGILILMHYSCELSAIYIGRNTSKRHAVKQQDLVLENSDEIPVALSDENAVLFRKKTMLKPCLYNYQCSSQTTKLGQM